MSRQAYALALVGAAAAAAMASAPLGARGAAMTQTVSLPSTTTNFDTSSVPPLVIQKFNTENGARILDSVSLNFSAGIQNQFSMTFVNPATITESFQSSSTGAQTGPGITLFEPDGKTALVTAQAPTLSRSETFGFTKGEAFPQTFSSTLPSTSPYYIKPSSVTATGNQTLTSAADLKLFTQAATGPNSISLPMSATSFAKMMSSSGNGTGSVSTMGTASVTVTYNYHLAVPAPQTAPEPATVLLWGLGGAAAVVVARRRARA